MLNLFVQLARVLWLLIREANRWIGRAIAVLIGSIALMIAASVWSPGFSRLVVPLATLIPLIAIGVLAPLLIVLIGVKAVARRFLLIAVGLWLAAGAYLSLVPVAHNPRLILPLGLVVLTLLALRLAGVKGWTIRILVAVILAITLVFFLGERKKANAKIEGTREKIEDLGWLKKFIKQPPEVIPPVNEDAECLDDKGHRKELHHESFSGSYFNESFPGGCGMLLASPSTWGRNWHAQPQAGDPNVPQYLYVRDVGGEYHGPYNLWRDSDMHINNPSAFYIQAVGNGVLKIHFWTDRASPPPIPGSPELPLPPTATAETVIEPVAITIAKAECTEEANSAHFSGTGSVSLIIAVDGKPANVEIAISTGIPSLDAKMVEAAENSRWHPATLEGRPVAFQISALDIQLEAPCQ